MGGLLALLLLLPVAVAGVAFLLFRYVALSRGFRPLIAVGSLWAAGLVYGFLRIGPDCERAAQGASDTGCGFVSFFTPLEQMSVGAAIGGSALSLGFWLIRSRRTAW